MDNGQPDQFLTPLSPYRLQSQLGKEIKRMNQEGKNVVRLSLARVVKVNYKYNTVDVVTTINNDSTVRNPNDNGKFSARLPVSFGGTTPDGKIYGGTTLVTVGSLVLIGYMEGNKDYPIVLNIYGEADNQSQLTRTTFTSADESDEALQRELWQLFTLYPSMTYKNIDGNGNQEVTFSGKSFLYVTDTDQDNAYVQDAGFNYEDLPSARYANGELIEPKSPDSPTLLYVHQGVYQKHRVTFFIKSDGTVRLGSRHLDGQGITFMEMTTDGGFQVYQKKDTTNPEEESAKFSRFGITEDGSVVLQSQKHLFEVNNEGIYVDGKPLATFGGGGNDGDGNPITWEDILNDLEDIETSITVMNGKIETKISRTEYDIDMDGVKRYAEELVEGVDNEIDDINNTLNNLDEYLDGSFKDGIIDTAEAAAIQAYINTLNTEKADIDAKYTEIFNNEFMDDQSRVKLKNAKDEYDGKHTALIDTINGAIVDGKISSEDRAAVDQAFDAYHNAVSTLSAAFESAADVIALNKAKKALEDAIGYTDGQIKTVNSTITQLADSISSKVDSTTFTDAIKNVDSRLATTEENIKSTDTRVDKIEKEIPYAVNIISTNGAAFQGGPYSTTLFAKILRGNQDVTNTVDASRFRWTRISNDSASDTEWNNTHGIGVKSITITNEDVKARATFQCDFDAPDTDTQ
ncbi:putative tail fiber 1 [Bacillus phage BSP36]|nr:putative tail fiber 1 [Bacillus phage BSP36]